MVMGVGMSGPSLDNPHLWGIQRDSRGDQDYSQCHDTEQLPASSSHDMLIEQ